VTRGRAEKVQGSDAAAIARASRVVTAQITAVAVAIVLVVVVVSVVYVIVQSQPSELLEKPAPGQTKIYVDADDLLVALAVVGAAAIVLAAVLSWVIARRAVRPLGQALAIQRTFVADASHELRTPVAVIGARVEVLKQRLENGHDPAGDLAELQRDVRVLGEVITDLLMASAPQTGVADPYPVAEVVESTVSDLRILAGRRDVELRETVDDGIRTRVPAGTLRRCVVVLVDNAIAHAPTGSVVDIVVASAGRSLFTLVVTDRGTGIVGIAPERIFDRFAHSAPLPGRTGFGLGLALVRDLADRHGGRIEVTDTSAEGTTFTLTLPRA
jgi:two-component system OmpR family sensor kinase